MADRFYTVSFNNTLYLTDDGLVTGVGCKLSETGIDTLVSNYKKQQFIDFRGNVTYQKAQVDKKAREIELNILRLPKTVGDDLLALHQDQDANGTTITMQVTHSQFPDYDLEVEIDEITFGQSATGNGDWKNVTVKVTTFGEA